MCLILKVIYCSVATAQVLFHTTAVLCCVHPLDMNQTAFFWLLSLYKPRRIKKKKKGVVSALPQQGVLAVSLLAVMGVGSEVKGSFFSSLAQQPNAYQCWRMENPVHTPEAAGVSASITFAHPRSSGALCADIHTHTQIAQHHGYLCHCGISEQPTHVVLTLLDYGD